MLLRVLLVACLPPLALTSAPTANITRARRQSAMMFWVRDVQKSSDSLSAPTQQGHDGVSSGWPAEVGQFPHQALVMGDEWMPCGGSLISRVAVLTAAHCTVPYKRFYIELGGIHLVEFDPTAWTVVSTRAVAHPLFTMDDPTNNDVAVIFLPVEAPLNRFINLVALPSMNEIRETYTGQEVIFSGYGSISIRPGPSEKLRWSKLSVISNEECQRHFKPGGITPTMLCSNHYIGACHGDSGSALVVMTPRGYKQIGVISFGPDDCSNKVPTVSTRVTSFLEWINSVTSYSHASDIFTLHT